MLPPVGICVSVTNVLVGNATLHTPDAIPSATVQLRPAGELVIVPPPREAGDGRTVSVAGMEAMKLAPMAVVPPDDAITVQVLPLQAPL
jgi:hypothetical protein